MNVIFKYLLIFSAIIIAGLGVTVYIMNKNINSLKTQNEILYNNVSAYETELSHLKDSIIVERGAYLFTIDNIRSSKDSVIQSLEETRKELGIKDNKIKEYQYLLSTIKTDTIINVTNIIGDSCQFDLEIKYNPQTIFNISLNRNNGIDELRHKANISASFEGIGYIKSEWKEPKFFKRLITFKWGKYHLERYVLKSDNEMVKINDFKVIKIIQ